MSRQSQKSDKADFVLVLDNIRSLYNIGSMFRSADGFGVSKLYLCGISGTPEQHGVQKVALGAEKSVAWEKAAHAWRVVEKLKRQGYLAVGLETTLGAVPLTAFEPRFPLALVVGNEVNGLSPAMIRRLDTVVRIPMLGIKESFNVGVACGVALYHISTRRLGDSK